MRLLDIIKICTTAHRTARPHLHEDYDVSEVSIEELRELVKNGKLPQDEFDILTQSE